MDAMTTNNLTSFGFDSSNGRIADGNGSFLHETAITIPTHSFYAKSYPDTNWFATYSCICFYLICITCLFGCSGGRNIIDHRTESTIFFAMRRDKQTTEGSLIGVYHSGSPSTLMDVLSDRKGALSGAVVSISVSSAITDELRYLRLFPETENLTVYGPINDEALRNIASINSLQTLDIHSIFIVSEIPITDVGLRHCKKLKNLRSLTIHNAPNITKEGIDELESALPNLTIIVDPM